MKNTLFKTITIAALFAASAAYGMEEDTTLSKNERQLINLFDGISPFADLILCHLAKNALTDKSYSNFFKTNKTIYEYAKSEEFQKALVSFMIENNETEGLAALQFIAYPELIANQVTLERVAPVSEKLFSNLVLSDISLNKPCGDRRILAYHANTLLDSEKCPANMPSILFSCGMAIEFSKLTEKRLQLILGKATTKELLKNMPNLKDYEEGMQLLPATTKTLKLFYTAIESAHTDLEKIENSEIMQQIEDGPFTDDNIEQLRFSLLIPAKNYQAMIDCLGKDNEERKNRLTQKLNELKTNMATQRGSRR